MSNDLIHIHNAKTDEILVREMTNEEQEQRDAEVASWLAKKEAKAQAAVEAQAKRQALLDKLGITEEEAQLLLGGTL